MPRFGRSSVSTSVSKALSKLRFRGFGSRTTLESERDRPPTFSQPSSAVPVHVPSATTHTGQRHDQRPSIQDYFEASPPAAADGSAASVSGDGRWTIPVVAYRPDLHTDAEADTQDAGDSEALSRYVFTTMPSQAAGGTRTIPDIATDQHQSAPGPLDDMSMPRDHVSLWAFNKELKASANNPKRSKADLHSAFLRELPSIKTIVSTFHDDRPQVGAPGASPSSSFGERRNANFKNARVRYRTPAFQIDAFTLSEGGPYPGQWGVIVERLREESAHSATDDPQTGFSADTSPVKAYHPLSKFMSIMHSSYLQDKHRVAIFDQDTEFAFGLRTADEGNDIDTYLNARDCRGGVRSARHDTEPISIVGRNQQYNGASPSSSQPAVLFANSSADPSRHKWASLTSPAEAKHTYLILSRDHSLFADTNTENRSYASRFGAGTGPAKAESEPGMSIMIGETRISEADCATIISNFDGDVANQRKLADPAFTAQLMQANKLIRAMPTDTSQLEAMWEAERLTTTIFPCEVKRRLGGSDEDEVREALLVCVEDRRDL
ncbi:hypothetical protein I316_02086 [Kwoniella heveanensis BCC8398]|uniref:Uncharacterized protein n=1 Tax=Kwoniella heveanensis BCC8398 TaxID=1296120 RepID=A0A1B9GYW5_9TREE|nr:hypothetical protein I316_02086 [Kwoniella heveanensis BCC8398]